MSSFRLFDLTGKVVWVVGGAGWLGAPSARALASAGAHVVISGRDGDRLADVVSAIQADGHSAESAVVDARDEEAVGALARDAGVAMPWRGPGSCECPWLSSSSTPVIQGQGAD